MAPGFGGAMRFQYDYIGLFISGGGIRYGFKTNVLKRQFNKHTLNFGASIGDFSFTSKSIYDYGFGLWQDATCSKCGN